MAQPQPRQPKQGSYGATPRTIHSRHLEYQQRSESAPDSYMRYHFPTLLDGSRRAVAKHLKAPPETIVLVTNATTAVNVVLRNLTWSEDGKDEIISFSTIYGGCGKTIDYITDTNDLVASRVVQVAYPDDEDEAIVSRFRDAVSASREQGRRPRIAVFDMVSSQPGVRFPFELVVAACRELDVLSLVDGAQGIGMLPLDLSALDADFFLSNCHKWLFVPKACAVLYVPLRHQHLITSTLPTSHGYVSTRAAVRHNPLPRDETKSQFVANFQSAGTVDNTAFACVADALQWRDKELGGEDRIVRYLWWLAKAGGRKVAHLLGTAVIDNKKGTLTDCAMVNVWLPVRTASSSSSSSSSSSVEFHHDLLLPEGESPVAIAWATSTLVTQYKTFIPITVHRGRWFIRLSAQLYLDLDDFEWAARTVKEVVDRLRRDEHKQPEEKASEKPSI
ncbi:hypothetical protein L249_5060 [Ophiocordyceps polyrhachis-furcata BCC 54312]|uniref:Aminotransferase class V domain-containing protein n=1 Tax=Ophiocordyceps polyrhachis-furcata BCC 54312 TaxID=1330021 RepID=A0A367L3T9_9HYPO|nr:hypothetical protein L249_5060 [Ophiocordyceps polyrhachis-furcata BCC 54312]